jgi:GDP-L-fucose synthase
MPCNLYGPNDNFNLTNSHVIPALIRKIHQAKLDNAPSVSVWGSGKAFREFLYIDDMADACIFLMENYSAAGTINVGTGEDLQIAELVTVMKDVIGFNGTIAYDTSKPDGTPRKVLDTTKINNLGWRPKFGLTDGLATTYKWFLENVENIRQ